MSILTSPFVWVILFSLPFLIILFATDSDEPRRKRRNQPKDESKD